MNTQAPAGWYPQPDGTQRYWDGSQWTEHIAPGAGAAAATPAAASNPAAAQPASAVQPAPVQPTAVAQPVGAVAVSPTDAAATDARPWWKKKRFIIPGAAVVAVFGISAIAVAGGGGAPAADPKTTPSETPLAQESPATEPTETAALTFTMPDLVGQNLQDAQDSLQALGSYAMDQTDASGQGRSQIDDSNWQVCTQEPAAGTEVPVEATVTLGSVKNDESCDGGALAEEPDTSGLTAEQVQAVGTAESYLEYTAFSKSGLIDQLEYEGFSKKDATAAVEVLDVNWTEQATLKAASYLEFTAFSKSGLIDQLEYEGFTTKQATAGVEGNDVDWNEQAAKKAEEYLDSMNFSKKELIAQLKYEGFSTKQAEYGVKQAGL